jgi:hypothetical protein
MSTANIFVYFTTDSTGKRVLEFFPNDEVHVPPKQTSTVVWTAVASPSHPKPDFVVTTIKSAGTNRNRVTIRSGATATVFTADIDNSNSDVKDAGVEFAALNPVLGQPQILGDSAIRNRGNSILVMRYMPIAISGIVSFVIGCAIGANWHTYVQ